VSKARIWIRPARATDKPAVEAICTQIWDGDDYIPEVWDEWLADPHGQLVVAELEGEVAGLAKLSRLADDEWWLEGLRVDPAHRRQGIGGQLQAHLVEKAHRIGRSTLRYGTHSLNEPVHRIAARDGFRHVATCRLYKANPLSADDAPLLRQLTVADLAAAWALVSDSPRHRAASGLYEVSWRWKNLTRERLAHHLAAGDMSGLEVDGRLAALALSWQDEDVLHVGYVDGAEEPLVPMLRGLRGLAAQRGFAEVAFKPVEEPALVAAVEAANYERSWDRDLWIFELALEDTPNRR
jgi:GNAT superfamily N-acetyltransferase